MSNVYSQYKEELLKINESNISKLNNNIYDTQLDTETKDAVESFNWDYNAISFYNEIFNELKNEKLNYRYFILLSKISNSHQLSNNLRNRVYYYYKLKFAILAIENGKNLPHLVADSIRKQIIETYYSASIAPNIWQSDIEFKEYAEFVLKYIDDLKYSSQFNKKTISLLYQTKADIIYEIHIITENNSTKISEVLLNYQMAINENKNNWKAFVGRGKLRFYRLNDYSGALGDYKEALKLEKQKEIMSSTNLTSFSFEIGECYLKLKKYNEAINFYSNTNILYLQKIKDPIKKISFIDKEIFTKYIGIFYFKIASSYHDLQNKKEACNNLRKAETYGYSSENLQDLKKLNKCD